MAVWHRIGARFRHPRTEDGAAPEVVPPLAIMLFIPLSALWLSCVLVVSLFAELSTREQIEFAIFGVVLPVGIIYGIMTNRRWSRVAILVAVASNIWLFAGLSAQFQWAQITSLGSIGQVALWFCLAAYLYSSKASRTYYLLAAGRPLPSELQDVDLSPPKAVAKVMASLSWLSEWILIILALVIFFGFLLGSRYV